MSSNDKVEVVILWEALLKQSPVHVADTQPRIPPSPPRPLPPPQKTPMGGGVESTVQYLHVGEVPGRYSAGIFVSPRGAQMPLHDHLGMVVLSQVLYCKLGVMSYNIIVLQPRDNNGSCGNYNGNDRMDRDCDDAHGN